MGHLKIDVLNKTLVYAQPVLLGGANSSHPVERDPAILAEIKAMEGPVKVLEAKVAGVCACAVRGQLRGLRAAR